MRMTCDQSTQLSDILCLEYWQVSSPESIDSTSSSAENMGSGLTKMFLMELDYSSAPVFPTEGTQSGLGLAVHNLEWKKGPFQWWIVIMIWFFFRSRFHTGGKHLKLDHDHQPPSCHNVQVFSALFISLSTYWSLVLQWVADCIDF